MFLTDADLLVMTGYKSRHHQRRWLAEHGYRHDLNRAGRPIVLVDEVVRKLTSPEARPSKKLNLDAIRG